jgi:hypothetical protein
MELKESLPFEGEEEYYLRFGMGKMPGPHLHRSNASEKTSGSQLLHLTIPNYRCLAPISFLGYEDVTPLHSLLIIISLDG